MESNRLLNTSLNLVYLALLKGQDGTGSGKVNSNWEITSQSAFDDYIDEYNAEFKNDSDLEKLKILKKGYPKDSDRIGIYVYTQSGDESIIIDYQESKIYATVFAEIRIRDEQSDFVWKYQDALMDYISSLRLGVEPGYISAKTYNKDAQDTANYSVVRIDFVLDYLTDGDNF